MTKIQSRLSHTKTYSSWENMLTRCNNPNNNRYQYYGNKGITVCERWLIFENFLTDMGERPEGTSLDRIDNNKGYYKENCRWATEITQANNKSTNRFITYKGETYTLKQWGRILGVNSVTISSRLKRGWTLEEAFQVPNRTTHSLYIINRILSNV